eukprot:229601_1
MSVEIETPTNKISSDENSSLLDPSQCTTHSLSYSEPVPTNRTPHHIVPFFTRPGFWFKISLVLILLSIFITAAVHYQQILIMIVRFMNWISAHPVAGIFAYLMFCWLWIVCMLPETALTVGGGFVFTHMYGTIGIVISIVLVFIGTQFGAIQAFINGRYLMRSCIQRIANKHPQFKVIDKIVERHGFKIAFLLRLAIITPYNVMNYLMGITSISLRNYVLGNFGMLPDCIMMCFIGSFLSSVIQIENISNSLSEREKHLMLIFSIVGTILAFVVACYVGVLAKRQFQKIAKEIELENQNSIQTNE